MSAPTYAKKQDANQNILIEAIEKAGGEVWIIGQPVDLLVRFRGAWHLLEVKRKRRKDGAIATDKRQERQTAFIASTGCPVVTTPLEALMAIGAISQKSLTPVALTI